LISSRPAYCIIVAPIGAIDPGVCDAVAGEVERVFGCRSEITPLLKDVEFALDCGRRQYHSTAILQKLAARAPDGALKIIAITQVDLFIPILTHVYGEAQLGGKTAIVSTFRLQEGVSAAFTNPTMLCRLGKEAVHELGHTFALRHCPERSCIMHYCRSLEDVDRKSNQLCRHCRVMLRDEMKKLGLDAAEEK
jgi:archaemetzincin